MNNISTAQALSGLQDAASPLDFIKANLRSNDAPVKTEAETFIEQTTEQVRREHNPVTPTGFSDPDPFESDEPKQASESEETPNILDELKELDEEFDNVEVDEERDLTPDKNQKISLAEKYKLVARAHKDLKKNFKMTAEEKAQLAAELEQYKTGVVESQKLSEYEQQIEDLKQYQHLHNFKMSKEYRENYEKPLTELKDKAINIAVEYGVDPAVLDQAINIDNKKDQNAFLKRAFGDEVGALEARNALEAVRAKIDEVREAEKQPLLALERVRREIAEAEERQATQRIENLIGISKHGWTKALVAAREDGRFPELVMKANDPEHNKYSEPIIRSAATEYGKFIKFLGAYGIKELPEEVTAMIANRFLISEAAGVLAESRHQHRQRADELLDSNKKYNPLLRPQVGAMNAAPAKPPSKPSSLTEGVDSLLNSVMKR